MQNNKKNGGLGLELGIGLGLGGLNRVRAGGERAIFFLRNTPFTQKSRKSPSYKKLTSKIKITRDQK